MSKKAKAEIADESAVIITDAVLAENQAKLDSYASECARITGTRTQVADVRMSECIILRVS